MDIEMRHRPLVYPILFDPPDVVPDSSGIPSIPVEPIHLATWQVSRESSGSRPAQVASRSTFFALAAKSNTIWILEERSRVQTPVEVEVDEVPSSPPLASPSSPHTFSSIGLPSPSRRSRATSSASSTPTSNTTRRRVSAFSPPQPPAICVTTSPALESASTFARTDREDLLETLREQKGRESLSGTRTRDSHESGRRKVVNGKEDGVSAGDRSRRTSFSRRESPIHSPESLGMKRDGTKMSKAELQEDVEGRAVDVEMERERRADEQELEDRKKVLDAGLHHTHHDHHDHEHAHASEAFGRSIAAPTQIILPVPGRGRIAAVVKATAITSLIVLRSSGCVLRTATGRD